MGAAVALLVTEPLAEALAVEPVGVEVEPETAELELEDDPLSALHESPVVLMVMLSYDPVISLYSYEQAGFAFVTETLRTYMSYGVEPNVVLPPAQVTVPSADEQPPHQLPS